MFRKLITISASALMLAGLGLAAAGAANASTATPKPLNTGSCGIQCSLPYFESSGPTWVQVDANGSKAVNNTINLQFRNTTNAHEDFLPSDNSTVIPEFCPGVVSDHFGAAAVDPIFSAAQCAELDNAGLDHSPAWQERYEPLGVYSGKCVGLWNNAAVANGTLRVRLENCGVSADTVWIQDTTEGKFIGGTFYAPYINGASSNFSDPEVITEGSGAPAKQGLWVTQLNVDSHNFVENTQLVGLLPGL